MRLHTCSLTLQVGMFNSERLQCVHTCTLMLHYSSGGESSMWRQTKQFDCNVCTRAVLSSIIRVAGNWSCDAKLSSLSVQNPSQNSVASSSLKIKLLIGYLLMFCSSAIFYSFEYSKYITWGSCNLLICEWTSVCIIIFCMKINAV